MIDASGIIAEAKEMLKELKHKKLVVVLIPAPDPQFIGHMVRYAANENPKWYKKIFDDRGYIHRTRVKRTLQRIINNKSTINDAYIDELIEHINETIEKYKFYA